MPTRSRSARAGVSWSPRTPRRPRWNASRCSTSTRTRRSRRLTRSRPLTARWITDSLLAVTLTNISAPNKVILYRFNEPLLTLTELERKDSGSFTGYLAVHPNRQFLYAQDSPLSGSSYTIRTFRVESGGSLTDLGVVFTNPAYALGLGVTPDGRRVYGGGGIAGGGNLITGFDVQGDGTLSGNPLGPWVSPGSSPSPKQAVATPDSRYIFVGHGSSSVVRSFSIDQTTGSLADTGFAFDVGIQGDLGGVATLGNLVLFTRKYSTSGPTGLFSSTVQPDGSFTANGPVVSTQGSLPQFIAVWDPAAGACYANCDQSTTAPTLNVADFTCFLQRFAAGDSYANCDQSTTSPVLNVADFTCFLQRFASGCP
jgi:6-phosphogluconolactonase (cycloisomerase 2 family)